MEITDVTATTHSIPVEIPLLGNTRERRIVFVEVETDAGITGYGLTAKNWWIAIREFLNREVAPTVEGMNPLETERVLDRLWDEHNRRIQTGAWSSAVSALDIALWDIAGKHYGEPVWRLLGGAKNPAPAYVTFGLLTFDRDQLAEIARDFVEQGETRLKMKVGIDDGENPAEDEARVAAVREAVGDDVELMVDANFSFSLNRAVEVCRRLEPYDITWIEEPVYGNDPDLLASLRERTDIPISAGQNEGHRFRHRELIESGAIDISQPNVCYVGGYTEGRKVASMADTYNLEIANGGGWPHHNAHLHAAAPNGWRVEYHYVMWEATDAIYEDPYAPDGNEVELPDEPGLGLTPDFAALERYAVE